MNTNTNTEPKPGQRIECVAMPSDPAPIPYGTQGTVVGVTQHTAFAEYHVHVAWDSGRTLNLVSSVDKWNVLS